MDQSPRWNFILGLFFDLLATMQYEPILFTSFFICLRQQFLLCLDAIFDRF